MNSRIYEVLLVRFGFSWHLGWKRRKRKGGEDLSTGFIESWGCAWLVAGWGAWGRGPASSTHSSAATWSLRRSVWSSFSSWCSLWLSMWCLCSCSPSSNERERARDYREGERSKGGGLGTALFLMGFCFKYSIKTQVKQDDLYNMFLFLFIILFIYLLFNVCMS